MVVIGAKGFAIEVLEVLYQLNNIENICFFDNVTKESPELLFNKYKIVSTLDQLHEFTPKDKQFVLGIGNPEARKSLFELFINNGFSPYSLISPKANIGHYEVIINQGCCIMTGTILTNSISIGKGVLINLNCTIGHNSSIGDFSELCPGVHISGNVKIGKGSFIGTGSVILPNISIGDNVIVGAGSVVTKDITDGMSVRGVPAK